MASLPADTVYGCDNITVANLPEGFKVYAGYWNGIYANMTALGRRFPSAYLISIAVILAGSKGSMAADAEPGTFSSGQSGNFNAVLAWIRQGTPGKPVVYTMAAWAADLEHFLARNGVPRSSYFLWTAHYTGQHYCSPDGCGYGASAADATQYATGYNDYNVFRGYMVGGGAQAPVPGMLVLGDTGPSVKTAQNQLNAWARYCGFERLITDGDYGGKTYNAVRLFQKKRGQGLAIDGLIGPETQKYLKNPPGAVVKVQPRPRPAPAAVPAGVPGLRLGSSGNQVAAMQYYLRNSGVTGVRGIDADGNFGPQTQTSVRNFQAYSKLTPDGVYGPATAKALAKVAVG